MEQKKSQHLSNNLKTDLTSLLTSSGCITAEKKIENRIGIRFWRMCCFADNWQDKKEKKIWTKTQWYKTKTTKQHDMYGKWNYQYH